MLTNTYSLSMRPGTKPLTIFVSQYDKGESLVFVLTHTSTSSELSSSGISAEIRGTKPDGNGFSYPGTYSYNNTTSKGSVTITLAEQMTAVAGDVICEIVLTRTSGGVEKQLGTANFILKVERAALDKDTLQSESEIRQLVNVIDHTDDIISAADRAQTAAETINNLAYSINESAHDTLESVNEIADSIAALSVGTVSTLDPNEAAFANITGGSSPVLNLGIPRGIQGLKGDDGTIENLDVIAETLPAGSQATASYSGNTLRLGIPKGDTGIGGTWGSITGTLSNQTDLQTALDNAGSKARSISITASSYVTTTWSVESELAGAPSGGTCYRKGNSVTGVAAGDLVILTSVQGCSGNIYVYCRDGTIFFEMDTEPVSQIVFKGWIIKGNGGVPAATKYIASISGVWGSITGTLSNQSDLRITLNAKANRTEVYAKTDVYTKTETDSLISGVSGKAWGVSFSVVSGWSTGTFSAAAVDAGAPSGGACYTYTYTNNNSPITAFSRYVSMSAKGYRSEIYVTPVSRGLRVETAILPASGNSLRGVVVNTDEQVLNGVATRIVPEDAIEAYLQTKANASEIGIVVTGNQTAQGADEGQYIILRGSTISGLSDGLYKAAQAIPANTAIDSTYLTAVSGGIAGAIKQLTAKSKTETITFDANGFAQTSLSRSNTILFLACDTNDWYTFSVYCNNTYNFWAVIQAGLKNQTHTVVLYYFDI